MATQVQPVERIHVPWAPSIPGVRLRHYRGQPDFTGMSALINASLAADGIEYLIAEQDIANDYEHMTDCDPETDMIMVEENGVLVGYARMGWYKTSENQRIYYHVGYVHPRLRGRGLGTMLLRFTERRAREIAKGHPQDGPRLMGASSSDKQETRSRLLKRAGYEAERFFFEMVRSLDEPLPHAPLPPGVEIRPAQEAHFRAIWHAMDEAFQDHWGHSPRTEEEYDRWINGRNFQPKLWKIAWDGDQIVGTVLNYVDSKENASYDRRRGYTEDICVRRPWRRKGVARALLVESMRMHREMGMQETSLGVDTDNPNGALRLYKSVGYTPFSRQMALRKPLNDQQTWWE